MKSNPQAKRERGGKPVKDRFSEERDHIAFDRALYKMGLDYHIRCEAYDQAVCVARDHRGIAVPTTPQERGLISRNARAIHMELALEAQRFGATADELWKAIQLAAREEFPIPAPAILPTYPPSGIRPFDFDHARKP